MFITPADLVPFAEIDPVMAAAMIADAEAMAVLTAPCLPGLTVAPEGETPEEQAVRLAKLAAVKAVLRGAILRWNDAGSGAVVAEQHTVGPFGVQNTLSPAARKSMFWPSEIEQLQGICSDGEQGKAYAVDTVGFNSTMALHLPWCDYRFGGLACSCGVDLTLEYPLYEIFENE